MWLCPCWGKWPVLSSFWFSGTRLWACCTISSLVWFPIRRKKKKNLSSTEWKALSVLRAPVLLLPDVNLTGLGVGAWGWGMSIFSSHASLTQFHSWGWLRGVVLPGDRGMAQRCSLAWSHYVTFPVTLGKLLFKNLPLSSYKSSPSPQISPNTEIQDINKAFGLSSSEGEPENRALFSS